MRCTPVLNFFDLHPIKKTFPCAADSDKAVREFSLLCRGHFKFGLETSSSFFPSTGHHFSRVLFSSRNPLFLETLLVLGSFSVVSASSCSNPGFTAHAPFHVPHRKPIGFATLRVRSHLCVRNLSFFFLHSLLIYHCLSLPSLMTRISFRNHSILRLSLHKKFGRICPQSQLSYGTTSGWWEWPRTLARRLEPMRTLLTSCIYQLFEADTGDCRRAGERTWYRGALSPRWSGLVVQLLTKGQLGKTNTAHS